MSIDEQLLADNKKIMSNARTLYQQYTQMPEFSKYSFERFFVEVYVPQYHLEDRRRILNAYPTNPEQLELDLRYDS